MTDRAASSVNNPPNDRDESRLCSGIPFNHYNATPRGCSNCVGLRMIVQTFQLCTTTSSRSAISSNCEVPRLTRSLATIRVTLYEKYGNVETGRGFTSDVTEKRTRRSRSPRTRSIPKYHATYVGDRGVPPRQGTRPETPNILLLGSCGKQCRGDPHSRSRVEPCGERGLFTKRAAQTGCSRPPIAHGNHEMPRLTQV